MKKPSPPSDLWEQMDAAVGAQPRVTMDGISVMEYAQRHNISKTTARQLIGEALMKGRLIQGWRKDQFHWTKVYRPK